MTQPFQFTNQELLTALDPRNAIPPSSQSGAYQIRCLENNNAYVGYSENVERRLRDHKTRLARGEGDNPKLQEDFNLYGEQAFVYLQLPIGQGFSKEALEILETQLIDCFSSSERYNFFAARTELTGERNSFYGKEHSEESKSKMREALQGRPSSFKGKTQSEDVKRKISEQNKGKSSAERCKPIMIRGKRYESISEAAAAGVATRRIIRAKCNDPAQTEWFFIEEH